MRNAALVTEPFPASESMRIRVSVFTCCIVEMCCVVQMSLVEMPSFSFNINVYGGDITFLPGVEKWINWFIETRVLRPYVLPERVTVPV